MAKKRKPKRARIQPRAEAGQPEEEWQESSAARDGEEDDVPTTDSRTYVEGMLDELGDPSGMGRIDDDWFAD